MTEKEILNARSRQHKIDSFNDLADRGEVYVHVNLSEFGVRVPERLKQGFEVVLKFSKRYGYKLEVLEEGVSQILSFQGEDFPVFIEWNAIFVIRDESNTRGFTYPWSAPKELIKKADDGEPPQYLN